MPAANQQVEGLLKRGKALWSEDVERMFEKYDEMLELLRKIEANTRQAPISTTRAANSHEPER